MSLFNTISTLLLLTVAGFSTCAFADDFPLAPGDEIELSVFARPDLSRTYRIRTDGTISLHIVGPIVAGNRTPSELEADIEDLLSFSFQEPVSATLEVAEWRPITVFGAVNNPGDVKFRAGTDVRIAVALADGILDELAFENQDIGTQMTVQSEVGRAKLLQTKLATLIAEQDQLIKERQAIIHTAEEIAPLDSVVDLIGVEAAQNLATAQTGYQKAKQTELELTNKARQSQLELATREAEAFGDRRGIVDDQLAVTVEEINDQAELLERGLARSSNLFDLQVDAGRLRADALEAVGLEAAALQKVERAVSGENLEQAGRLSEISAALLRLEREILEVSAQLEAARDFVVRFGGGNMLGASGNATEAYEIFRRTEQGVQRIEAELDTLLMPGDTLSVLLDLGH